MCLVMVCRLKLELGSWWCCVWLMFSMLIFIVFVFYCRVIFVLLVSECLFMFVNVFWMMWYIVSDRLLVILCGFFFDIRLMCMLVFVYVCMRLGSLVMLGVGVSGVVLFVMCSILSNCWSLVSVCCLCILMLDSVRAVLLLVGWSRCLVLVCIMIVVMWCDIMLCSSSAILVCFCRVWCLVSSLLCFLVSCRLMLVVYVVSMMVFM